MSVTRRTILKGALLTAAAVSCGAARALSEPSTALVVYDSRLPQSLLLRSRYSSVALDVAVEHASCWRNLRAMTPNGRIVGLTSWSDLVLVRGFLEEKRKRLRTEVRRGDLFYWEMSGP
jgi:hypothetical protein